MPLLRCHGLVVAVAHIVGDRLVELLLRRVPVLPGDGLKPGDARLEERIALRIDRDTLFRAHHEGSHTLARHAALVREGIPVDQLHQPMELVGLALMRRRRQEEDVGRGFRQRSAQLVACDLIRAPAHAVRFVDDHQIPRRRNQVLEALPVVGAELFEAPAPPPFERLHGIQRADDLIMQTPEVLFVVAPLPEGGKLGRFDELEVLPEMQPHLGLPLADQPFGRDHQDPLRHAAQLELAQDEPGFDRLAEAYLVGEQISNAVPAHGPVEGIELVRQRHDARLDGRQQEVFLQRVPKVSPPPRCAVCARRWAGRTRATLGRRHGRERRRPCRAARPDRRSRPQISCTSTTRQGAACRSCQHHAPMSCALPACVTHRPPCG